MSEKKEKSFFDRLGELLNAPLPGTEKKTADKNQDEEMSIEDRIKDMLNPASPDVNAADQSVVQPKLADEEMQGNWWENALNAFAAHQEKERNAFNNKQIYDQKVFADYQVQEKAQFDNFQKHEFELFWSNIEKQSGKRPPSAPPAPPPGSFNPPGMGQV
jgi:hypothetical protein